MLLSLSSVELLLSRSCFPCIHAESDERRPVLCMQIMNEEHSPRWAQREQDDVTAAPLCVLPSTYHAMTPPTSVSTVMAPHLPESSPDLPHHGYSAAGVYGDPGAHVHGAHAHAARLPVAGFMGGLNGPAPQPPSPHYTPPKPPSIAAAQRYAAPRPPPPPHPPTTVGSVTSEGDQSVATCSTALAGTRQQLPKPFERLLLEWNDAGMFRTAPYVLALNVGHLSY